MLGSLFKFSHQQVKLVLLWSRRNSQRKHCRACAVRHNLHGNLITILHVHWIEVCRIPRNHISPFSAGTLGWHWHGNAHWHLVARHVIHISATARHAITRHRYDITTTIPNTNLAKSVVRANANITAIARFAGKKPKSATGLNHRGCNKRKHCSNKKLLHGVSLS